MKCYRSVAHRYGMLESVTEYYGVLCDIMETLRSSYGIRNVTQQLRKIVILPIIN